jgi:peptide/nickel transport system substrate-binding protein
MLPLRSLLLPLAMLLAGCSPPHNPQIDEHVIKLATGTPLQTFDPHLADSGSSFSTYLTLVYDGLVEANPDSHWRPLPGLARTWRWLNETTIEFELIQGVTFTDGAPFDANVAKANIDRMLKLAGPRVNTVATIKETEVIDNFTFRIHLHRTDPTLLGNLTGPTGMMISPAAFEDESLDLRPVGSGPWRYDAANSTLGDVHRFVPRENYHGDANPSGAPLQIHVLENARARLNALISGQVNIAILSAVEAGPAKDRGFAIQRRANRWYGITYLDRRGELVPELADPRVRRAIGFAIDRKAITDAVFFGYAKPTGQPMFDDLGQDPELDTYYRYDPDHARRLLQSAGVERLSFVVPIISTDSPLYEAVQHYLRQVGIDIRLEVVERGSLGALARTRTYPVNTLTYPTFGPDSRHPAIWGTNAVFNPFNVHGPRIDALAEEASTSLDEALRARNYRDYYHIIVKDAYSTVILQLEDLVAYDADVLDKVRIGYVTPILRHMTVKQGVGSP